MAKKKEQPEVKSGTSKPKSKHLVLDAAAQELFNKAYSLTGAETEKQAVQEILSRFCENGGVNELKDCRNPDDVAEIERLKELTCDKVNCELTAELTQVNSDLTAKNEELTQVNSELKEQLNALQLEVNSAGKKLIELDFEKESANKRAAGLSNIQDVFGRLNWLLLKWCAARYQKEKGKEISPEQALRMLFDGYLQGKLFVFTKPNGYVIEVFKQRIKQDDRNNRETKKEA